MACCWMNRIAAARAALLMLTGMLVAAPGCENAPAAPEGSVIATIDGEAYTLEIVADEASRQKGMAFRDDIPDGTGMVFAFPDVAKREFVMRDCLVPIDIIFLDPTARVTATHHMPVEPRNDGESDIAYERRLKRYSSRFSCQFVIEVRGGDLETLNVNEGDRIDIDIEALKAAAR